MINDDKHGETGALPLTLIDPLSNKRSDKLMRSYRNGRDDAGELHTNSNCCTNLERLLAGVDSNVLLEVVFELERLPAFRTFEFSQHVVRIVDDPS